MTTEQKLLTTGQKLPGSGNCSTCQTRHKTEWCVLDNKALELIENSKFKQSFQPGEVLFREGDRCQHIYCIETGKVAVRKFSAKGQSIILYLMLAGDTLGYRELLTGEDYRVSAEVIEPSTICLIDPGSVLSLLEHNPILGLRFLKRSSAELSHAEERILHNSVLSVRARFAHLLVVLINRLEVGADARKHDFELPLSRHDLASMIGTTPESMSRIIRQLENDGVVHFSGRNVHIPNLNDLIKEFEPEYLL